jgi:uncharacterized membrane protein
MSLIQCALNRKEFYKKIIKMKVEINNQTAATIGVVFALLIIEFLMPVFKVGYGISISINIFLCVFFNIYNYQRFGHFQTKKDLQLTNKKLAFASLLVNLPLIAGIIALLFTQS